MNHTKGVWECDTNIAKEQVTVWSKYNKDGNEFFKAVATLKYTTHERKMGLEQSKEEAEANGRLIAVAPGLLEFVSRMVSEDNFIDPQDKEEAILLISLIKK
jgi:hypothetical protein